MASNRDRAVRIVNGVYPQASANAVLTFNGPFCGLKRRDYVAQAIVDALDREGLLAVDDND